MSFVAVLPSIHPPYTWTCLQSMHPADVLRLMAKAGYDAEHLATDHEAHWRFSPR